MRILLLSKYPEKLQHVFKAAGDTFDVTTDRLTHTPHEYDHVVSFGYSHLIPGSIIDDYRSGDMINLHISLLPWNRGSDPNFWSWFDQTPKGFTIHRIDAGVDTGPVFAQRKLIFGRHETLASSHQRLQSEIIGLFSEIWPDLRSRKIRPAPQFCRYRAHKLVEKSRFLPLLTRGWDTPCSEVEQLGLSVGNLSSRFADAL